MSHKYLDYIREHNKAKASICKYCDKPSTDLIAIGAYLNYVCKTHAILYGPNTQVSFEE